MREEYVEFEVAMMAKNIGFDWPSNECYFENEEIHKAAYFEGDDGYYTNTSIDDYPDVFIGKRLACVRPTQSLLMKWLRAKYGIHMNIFLVPEITIEETGLPTYNVVLYHKDKDSEMYFEVEFEVVNENNHKIDESVWETYEHAVEQGLFEGMDMILRGEIEEININKKI